MALASVIVVHTFEQLIYLQDQWPDFSQNLPVASFGLGKGCIVFLVLTNHIIAPDKALVFIQKVLIFLLFLHENMLWYSLEGPLQGAPNE